MENKIVKVDFQGGELEAVKQGEKVWVSVRRCCESLGIASNGQIEKLKEKEWACSKIILSHDTTGREQKQFMIDLDSFPMWLGTIETSRVKKEIRPMLVKYQKEAAKVLRDHFFGTPKMRRTESPVEKEMRLMARENRLAAQQRARGYRIAIEAARRAGLEPNKIAVYEVKQAEVLTGENLDTLLPAAVEERLHSPTEIGQRLGVSANRVGRTLKDLGIHGDQTLEFCEKRMNKSQHSNKQMPSYFYNEKAIEMVASALECRQTTQLTDVTHITP